MEGPSAQWRRLLMGGAIADEDRKVAGMASGGLFLLGAATLVAVVFMPGVPHGHRTLLLGIAAGAGLLGAVLLTVVPWQRVPGWAIHPMEAIALTMIAAVVASSGGSMSAGWVYVLPCAFFSAYFYRRPTALAYLLVCAGVQAAPLLYDARASRDGFVAQLLIAAPVYVGSGWVINAGKRRLGCLRARAEMLAAEQSALRRVASAVAEGATPERIYEMVAVELGRLTGAGAAAIMRLESSDSVVVAGSWAAELRTYAPGTRVPVPPGSEAERCLETGRPQATRRAPSGSRAESIGAASTLVTPVKVGGRNWGMLAVASANVDAFDGEAEQMLEEFSDLLATAVASAEERTRLAEQALSDPLTGLANQRALQRRMVVELARVARHGSPLSVAVIDIDQFKDINDNAGHETGDEMLVRVAAALNSFARAQDTLARVGGDEFAWLLPDTTREQALVAVERARRLIAAAPPDPYQMTISAGICDTDSAGDRTELLRLADSALYWSKAHGRNQTWVYDPAVVDELSNRQRAERLQRAQELQGLRALVRAHEGRDAATHEHSERVAGLAVQLAEHVGWSRERALLLNQAALVHDVGRVASGKGLPPAGAPLSADNVPALRLAARASAEMVRGLLDDEQVKWIAGQYTAPTAVDGPLHSAAEGASLLALADAWDTLTAVTPGLPAEALARCTSLAWQCFSPQSVQALRALAARLSAGSITADGAIGADD